MKSKNISALFLVLFTALATKTNCHVQTSTPWIINELPDNRLDYNMGYAIGNYILGSVGAVITLVIALVSGIKMIRAFLNRHDYAQNFISDPYTIASYSIKAQAITKQTRSQIRSKTINTKTFSGKKFEPLVKECGEWANAIDTTLLLVIQPSLCLHSEESYNLKKLILRNKEREHLEEELTDIFYVPNHNRFTYEKRMALWSIPLGGSIYGFYRIVKALGGSIFGYQIS